MTGLTIAEMASRIRDGAATSTGLVAEALEAGHAAQDALHPFALLDDGRALGDAEQADRELAGGLDRGPLHGVPVAVKDIVDVAGWPTRCGSPAYPETPVDRDATVVSRLREAGAVIIGKTTSHELACGVYSAPAANPWDPRRLPGGSSGGSGAAVAAGIVPMALGSDTGGSIRIPAAVCGVAGLKPTFGRVSRTGVEPLSWSLDHVGPIAATVGDCAISFAVLAGRDASDPSTMDEPVPDPTTLLDRDPAHVRVGVLGGSPFAPMEPGVESAFASALETLAEIGAELVDVEVPELGHTIAAEFAIVGAEAGHYHRERLRRDPELIEPGIRALLVSGLLLPASYYLRALQARVAITAALRRVVESAELDALVTPTLPAVAALRDQEEIRYGDDVEPVTVSYVRTTAPFNLAGLPALSIPCGLADGLPVGLQIVGRPLDEARVLSLGHAFEAATGWHSRLPAIHASEAS